MANEIVISALKSAKDALAKAAGEICTRLYGTSATEIQLR